MKTCQVVGYSCMIGDGTCSSASCGNISCNEESGGPQ